MMKLATENVAAENVFEGLESTVVENHPLARHTWYRIGGPARYFATPKDESELAEIIRRAHDADLPIRFLGLGANVLISDHGVDGLVIRLSEPFWEENPISGSRISCRAGADVQKLVLKAARAGLAGIECMAGIPGTVGGAVRMNAGGKFGDFGTSVVSLRLMDSHGEIADYSKDDIHFTYRHSELPMPYILGATIELAEDNPDDISKRTKDIWMYKRNSQPMNAKSAGCVFKNPDPELSAGRSAGALIDQAGLKGLSVGGATVSPVHANFFVASPGCAADDIVTLIDTVKARVYDRFGVELHTEVKVWR